MHDQIDITALPHMASELLTDIYQSLYKEELQEITDFDPGVSMSVEVEDTFSNRYFEDESEEAALIKEFSKDYNEGKFVDPAQYKSLIKKHATLPNEHTVHYEEQQKANQPCTPEIHLNIDHTKKEEQTEQERFEALKEFIEKNDKLPNGMYFLNIREEDPEETYDRETYHDLVLICEE